jgi:hypothetical protein
MMYRFLVVIEKADGNYSAYAPDLPGCVATGKTLEEGESVSPGECVVWRMGEGGPPFWRDCPSQ